MYQFPHYANNGPIPVPMAYYGQKSPQFSFKDAIQYALRTSLTIFMIQQVSQRPQTPNQVSQHRFQKTNPPQKQIEEFRNRSQDKKQTKSCGDQVKTSIEEPKLRLRKKITNYDEDRLNQSFSPQVNQIEQSEEDNQRQNQNLNEEAMNCEEDLEIFNLARIPEFGLSNEEIIKKRQSILSRKVHKWSQIEKIGKQKYQFRSELRRLF